MKNQNKSAINSRFIASSVSLGVIALMSLAAPAHAQEGDTTTSEQEQAQANFERNPIIVLGVTRQEENIQEVPTTITAFSGEDIVEQGIVQTADIATFTPGFNVRAAGNNPTAFNLSMRGQIQVDNIATLEPSVGTYIDDIYIGRAYGLNTNLLDIESVQVLKGPQGTLFGRNTSAGAVVIQTVQPQFDEVSGVVRGTYGRYDQREAEAVINLGFEHFAIRGSFFYGARDNYQTDVTTGDGYGEREVLNGRVRVSARPLENLTITASGEWFDSEINGPGRSNLFLNVGGADPAAAERAVMQRDRDFVGVSNVATFPGAPARGLFNEMETETYMLRADLETSFGEVNFITGYRNVEGANLIDLDGSAFPAHFTQGFQDLDQFSAELRATGSAFDDLIDFAVGATYFAESGNDQSRSSLFSSPNWSNFNGFIDNDSIGIYAQVSAHVTDRLTITGGARYSIDDKGVTVQSSVAPNNGDVVAVCLPTSFNFPPATFEDCARTRYDTFDNLSYTIGFDYQLTDDILFYAKHSRGYRSGVQQLRSLTLTDTTPAQPEINNEQEIGLKTEFWGGRAIFNIAGFHNRVSNAQRSPVFNVNGQSQTIIENAGTETWGVEADFSVEVADGFFLFASGSLIDPSYTNYDGFGVVGAAGMQQLVSVDKSDFPFVGIVEEQFTVGASYETDLGFGRLHLNATYAWQGEYNNADTRTDLFTANPVTTPGGLGLTQAQADQLEDALVTGSLGLLNARAALSFGYDDNYEIAVWGRNILGDREPLYTLLLGNVYVGSSFNDPATYGVTLTARF
ncbi:TonB-dependent receptor [uncultured Parasphingopyxis sp.]|uniref:TonB-dependent receptor n=1 Tax=uncultured Parasphingopyxis sp. TaxID=1547918 RepID=UPI0026123B76|nr:TonB-dependent receptor [uncultured Parasphingopyxis sp.]